MRIKEMIPNLEALDCQTNSPFQYHKKCKENSEENFKTNVWVLRIKRVINSSKVDISITSIFCLTRG